MHKEHYLFEELPDSTIIWKYMEFDKFLSLLMTRSLYFCRSDKFEDPYEGTITKETIEQIRMAINDFDFENKDEMLQQMLLLLNTSRSMTLVNCWHLNEFESDGMWKLYTNVRNSIAIQTTVGKLKEAFKNAKQDVFVGKVRYIDFEKEFVEGFTMLGPFIYKRKSFAHEQEIRAVIWELGSRNADELVATKFEEGAEIPVNIVEHGKPIDVEVGLLIEKVYISPVSDFWFINVVKDIINKYGFDFEIITSRLLSNPEYILSEHSVKLSDNTIKLPLEVLKAFIEKDSFRIQREEDDRLRTISLQTNTIQQNQRLIEERIKEITFIEGAKKWDGSAAITEIGKRFLNFGDVIPYDLLFAADTNIFMLVGHFDNLMIEIESSIIPDREKAILFESALYLFTEKCMTGMFSIALTIIQNRGNLDVTYADPLQAFAKTVFKFAGEIDARKI